MATGLGDKVSDRLARVATWRPGGGQAVRPEERLPVILLTLGAICMPLGIVFILLGWWGAAHTPYGFEQTPYLISGGLLGLGFILAGGFLFFGAWIARVALHGQRTTDHLVVLIERMARLGDGVGGVNGGPTPAATASAAAGRLVATATGSMLHRPDCPIVASRDNLRDVAGDERDQLKPCQICDPLGVPA